MEPISRTVISTAAAARPVAPYSQAIIAGRTVYLSGCLGLDPATKAMVAGGAAEQMKKALQNMKATLEAAGSSVEKVVKTTIYLADMADFPAVNEQYKAVFSENFPARTAIQVARLPLDALVEIEAIGLVGDVQHANITIE